MTPEDYAMNSSGSFITTMIQTNSHYEELPFLEGKELGYSSTEIISSDEEDEKNPNRRTIYMARIEELHDSPPEILDIHSSDESESNILPDEEPEVDEDEEQKNARLKRNKLKAGRRNRARQRRQAWKKYKAELIEYNKKK